MKKYNKKIKIIIFTLVAVFAGISVTSFALGEDFWQNKKTQNQYVAQVINGTENKKVSQKYFYFNRSLGKKPSISAKSYIVGDLNTGEIIMSKDANEPLPIASVSKLMTALIATQIKEEGDIAKVSKQALSTYGQNGNFKLGENIKVEELLYPLLLESSNDASEIIAETYDRDSFIRKMNLQAQNLKMENTFFEDPSGLSENNISSSSDLFKLAGFIKHRFPEILEITKIKSYVNEKHNWSNNNQFLRDSNYTGGKSGYTSIAKQTVVSVFSLPLSEGEGEGERPVGIVLLGSNDRYQDVQNILKYLQKHVYYAGPESTIKNWISESLALPDIKDPDFVTMTFLGDIMMDRGVRSSVNKNFQGNYSALFENMEVLKEKDIVFGNLEGVASDKGTDLGNLYSFRMNPSVIPALKGAGFSILSVANNHVGDWGREAYIDTLQRLEENEILYTGGGNRKKAIKPTIIEKYGIKIGFLAFSDVGPNWMVATEEKDTYDGKTTEAKVGLLLANDPDFEDIIKKATEEVDHLVVSFHFGDEYKKIHNQRQEDLAHKAIDNGAKIVIGHHPHVTEDTEVYKDGFIAYSLGNFIFDQYFSKDTMQGSMLDIKLAKDGTMSFIQNTVKLNKAFQPEEIIEGKEIKIEFD